MRRLVPTTLVLLALTATPTLAVPVLSIIPSAQSIGLGEDLQVDITISGLEGDVALGGFDLRFVYNPLVLDFVTLEFGNQLDLSGFGSINFFAEDPNPTVGAVDLFELSLDSVLTLQTLQSDSFVLATLSFAAMASGSSTLNMAIPSLSDAFGSLLSIDSVVASTVRVAEPGVLGLFVITLLGIAYADRRRVAVVEIKKYP